MTYCRLLRSLRVNLMCYSAFFSGARGASGPRCRREAGGRAPHGRHHQRIQHGEHRRPEPRACDHFPPSGDRGPGPHSDAAALRPQRRGGAHEDYVGVVGGGPQGSGRRHHRALREHLEGLLGRPLDDAGAPQIDAARCLLGVAKAFSFA